jgi:para-nitrobenzyl esterase
VGVFLVCLALWPLAARAADGAQAGAKATDGAQVGAKATDGGQVKVETPLGPVAGVAKGEVSVFLGLPFAKPPVGDLRFAPPQNAEPWTAPREALKPGPMCSQIPMDLFQSSVASNHAFPGYSEDCLNLNVWTPVGAKKGDNLPVYVFIHGGGFGLGAGSQAMYDGSALAKEGLVVVTFNYRLGALGFFASQETLKQYDTTGNWGILDQIKALEWVRDNVSAFGGDPAKVTVGGESAGSFSVAGLILSPRAQGLFRSAIMESGTIFGVESFLFARGKLDLALKTNSVLASAFGAADDPEGLAKLRKADANLLTRLSPFGFDFTKPVFLGMSPIKDGKVIPTDPLGALAEGHGQKVKVLMGFNGDEGTLFVPAPEGSKDDQVYKDAVFLLLGAEGAKAFWERFPVDKNNDIVARTRQVIGYAFMSSTMKRFADLHAQFDDVYFYRFDYVTQAMAKLGLGAAHASELAYVFDFKMPMVNFGEKEQKLSDEMRLRWVNFIKNGDPNVGSAPPTKIDWPKYDPQNPQAIVFNETVTAGPFPDLENLDFMTDLVFGPLPRK